MESGPIPPPASGGALDQAGDEAILPPGARLVVEGRPGRQCFVLVEGTAAVEVAGARVRELGAGDFVGSVDHAGRPSPAEGITVRLESRARVLIIDPGRLAALIDSDPAAADAWRRMNE
jgi:CRP-like cAMP-binding protein